MREAAGGGGKCRGRGGRKDHVTPVNFMGDAAKGPALRG